MRSRKGSAIAAGEATDWPGSRRTAAQSFVLLRTLNERLLASHSATSTLEQWSLGALAGALCDGADRGAQAIRARRVAGVDRPASAEQRARLAVGPDELVIYRRVELAFGDRVLSEAENWYVPSRLTAAIRKILAETDTPFGRAVMDLNPVRETFAVELFWRPDDRPSGGLDKPVGSDAIPWRLFQHRALVYGEGRRPVSEVNETYTREILAFGDASFQDKSIA
jgi:chorismate-pyruvate lyase